MLNPWDRFALLEQTQESWSEAENEFAVANAHMIVLPQRAASAGLFTCGAAFMLLTQE